MLELSQVKRRKLFSGRVAQGLQEEKAQQLEYGWCGGKRPEVGMEIEHELMRKNILLKSPYFTLKLMRNF